jgi:hypothetical protein
MKKFSPAQTFTIFLLLFAGSTSAGNNILPPVVSEVEPRHSEDPVLKSKAEQFLSASGEKGFLENRGQMMDMEGNPVPQVLFKTEAPGLNIWVTQEGLVVQTLKMEEEKKEEDALNAESRHEEENIKVHWERVDIILKNASIRKENIVKENPKQEHYNFFYPHCPKGIYEVKEYEKITIKDVYPGIDWVLYRKTLPLDKGGVGGGKTLQQSGMFKYDFIVHPGADYKQIELLYSSKTPIIINTNGELEMHTLYGKIKENKPVSFYEGKKVETKFKLNAQKPITINGDHGYETSIDFDLSFLTCPLKILPKIS